MVALGRSLSFRRRNQKAEKAEDPPTVEAVEDTPVPKEEPPARNELRVTKIIRSASFGRRGSKAKSNETEKERPRGETLAKERDEPLTAEEESSESRPVTPEDKAKIEATAHEMTDAELEAIPLSNTLQGWLKKRHQKQPHQWARRFFLVNDERGTIAYSKGEKGKRFKPSVVLSLQDISMVKLVTLDDASNAFLICCPPVSLHVSAEDREEAQMWTLQLNKRMRVWREKAALKTRVATAITEPEGGSEALPPSETLPPDSAAPNVRDVVREEKLEPRDALCNERVGRTSPPERRGSHGAMAGDMPSKPAASRALQQYPEGVQHYPPAMHLQQELHPARMAKRPPAAEPRATDSSSSSQKLPNRAASPAVEHVLVRPTAALLGRSPLENTSIETIDFGEDSDKESPTPRAERSPDGASAINPWAMPTRNLAELLSSDEDEDDEEYEAYAPLTRAHVAPQIVSPAHVAPQSVAPAEPELLPEPEHAAALQPATRQSGVMSWLDAMPDTAFDGEVEDVEDLEQPSPVVPPRSRRPPPRNDWDSDEEEPPLLAPPQPPPPVAMSRAERRAARLATAVPEPELELHEAPEPELELHEAPEPPVQMVGDGIHADSNFVEDDWDDDDDE